MDRTEYKKDELVVITSGSYSDYGIEDVARFTRDCDITEYCTYKTIGNKKYLQTINYNKLFADGVLAPEPYTDMWCHN